MLTKNSLTLNPKVAVVSGPRGQGIIHRISPKILKENDGGMHAGKCYTL